MIKSPLRLFASRLCSPAFLTPSPPRPAVRRTGGAACQCIFASFLPKEAPWFAPRG